MIESELTALALDLKDAAESAHFGKRDFRVRGRIFMSLPEPGMAVLKLTPDQQQMALAVAPDLFQAVTGGWGQRGWTRFRYPAADGELVRHWLAIAWGNVAPKTRRSRLDD